MQYFWHNEWHTLPGLHVCSTKGRHEHGPFRLFFGGISAFIFNLSAWLILSSVSYPLSARRVCASLPWQCERVPSARVILSGMGIHDQMDRGVDPPVWPILWLLFFCCMGCTLHWNAWTAMRRSSTIRNQNLLLVQSLLPSHCFSMPWSGQRQKRRRTFFQWP